MYIYMYMNADVSKSETDEDDNYGIITISARAPGDISTSAAHTLAPAGCTPHDR